MKQKEFFLWKWIDKILRWIIYKLFHSKMSEEKYEGLLQFVEFGIVGLSNTVISYVVYVAFLKLFQKVEILPKTDYLVAQVIAFIISVLWSFYWNNKYVFETNEGEQRNTLLALIKTFISYAFTGLFLNSVLSILWVEVVGIPKIVAPIINLLISVPLNYIINKFWAFKKKKVAVSDEQK